jgi:hypothetical protein
MIALRRNLFPVFAKPLFARVLWRYRVRAKQRECAD